MKTLILIPAHNEEESLPALLEEVRKTGCDAVVINDASTDATERVAKAAGFPVLSLSVNLASVGGYRQVLPMLCATITTWWCRWMVMVNMTPGNFRPS